MPRTVSRVGLLMAAVLLAVVGTVIATNWTSAAKSRNQVKSPAVTQVCTAAACAKDVLPIPEGTFVDTYCVLGDFTVAYTGRATDRGGFLPVSAFDDPAPQATPCDNSGFFGQVGPSATDLSPCSGQCGTFGSVAGGTSVRGFCRLSTPPDQWFLVFVEAQGLRRAGFVRESALSVEPDVSGCDPAF